MFDFLNTILKLHCGMACGGGMSTRFNKYLLGLSPKITRRGMLYAINPVGFVVAASGPVVDRHLRRFARHCSLIHQAITTAGNAARPWQPHKAYSPRTHDGIDSPATFVTGNPRPRC